MDLIELREKLFDFEDKMLWKRKISYDLYDFIVVAFNLLKKKVTWKYLTLSDVAPPCF